MDTGTNTARLDPAPGTPESDQRAAPRFTLLIRAAKLVSAQGEFVCVIRDVSETGVSVRLFHALPGCKDFALHMPAGAVYEITAMWQRNNRPVAKVGIRGFPFGVKSDSRFGCRGFALSG
ncbi:PilZ domain-containing protein [Porphyrobacter sp. TH134]|uniref:PilZ domain-containing protein n=1 Tax=Porphyrobacter sp. TH134 TaxID=2067450 RepID=UPI00267A3A12|nr:PilZ domain-containing protein [Porphyrobacter sp. TH134]